MSRPKKDPEMIGVLANEATSFITYKRDSGFKYSSEPKCLARLCKFCDEQGLDAIEIPKSLAEAWIAPRSGESSKTRNHRITCIRQFAIFLDALGYEAYIIPEQNNWNNDSFVPYIFTHEQISSLIQVADETTRWGASRNLHLELPVIFRLLYGCGLRVSEAVNLRYTDVDLDRGILTIREAKTDRDRMIPLSESVHEAFIQYAEEVWWDNDTDYFFPAPDKTMLSPMTIYQRYRRYLQEAGISHRGKGHGPRLHDLRHTFAVHVLQKWISEGADLTAMIPILSTYMGHKSIRSTSKYLRLTAEVYPELMQAIESNCAYVIPEVCSEGN